MSKGAARAGPNINVPDLQLIMKRKSVRFALASLTLMSSLVYGAQSSRPDLSGIWLLDREKSDLKSPPISTDPPISREPAEAMGVPGQAAVEAWAMAVMEWVVATWVVGEAAVGEVAGTGWAVQHLGSLVRP